MAIALIMSAIACMAKENDSDIQALQIITMDSAFGISTVSATFTNGMEGKIFSSLTLETDGNKYVVPAEQLQDAARVYTATIKVTSEVGDPYSGLSPYIYIRFDGHDGTKQAKYRIVFGPGGFKEIRKEGIQQSVPAYGAQSAPTAEP